MTEIGRIFFVTLNKSTVHINCIINVPYFQLDIPFFMKVYCRYADCTQRLPTERGYVKSMSITKASVHLSIKYYS